MLDMTWKWKLNDKRTQGRYVEKGLMEKSNVEAELKKLPDLAANATWVEIDMEDVHVDEAAAEENGTDTDGNP